MISLKVEGFAHFIIKSKTISLIALETVPKMCDTSTMSRMFGPGTSKNYTKNSTVHSMQCGLLFLASVFKMSSISVKDTNCPNSKQSTSGIKNKPHSAVLLSGFEDLNDWVSEKRPSKF